MIYAGRKKAFVQPFPAILHTQAVLRKKHAFLFSDKGAKTVSFSTGI